MAAYILVLVVPRRWKMEILFFTISATTSDGGKSLLLVITG